jgi:putative transposase
VTLDFSGPGKPTDNSLIESFNGSFRDECLNLTLVLSLKNAIDKIESWRDQYNTFGPHRSLDDLTPRVFAIRLANTKENNSRFFLSVHDTENGGG